ncbi:hypothetical protein [Planobispora longispora]|uniref:Uncharacterized protein n=1 Tax=Planobispora longispora TaxID=28887 RepID=A0A8J3W2X7_9ACTN|nr:hypothetical protein [Planobispora longispora]GIH74222.1 hypothetical protein Plo01_06510 [Planobispora longispora]
MSDEPDATMGESGCEVDVPGAFPPVSAPIVTAAGTDGDAPQRR